MEDKIITYGGQAVIEGVMMRGQKAFAIAMRAPDGNIVVHKESLAAVYRSRIAKIPFLRGTILLWDALGLGMRALTISANTQTGEEEKLEGPALYLTLATSLAIGIAAESAAPSLTIPPGARANGMGEAYVAVSDDATASWWNVGGMAFIKNRNLAFMYSPLVPDLASDVNYQFLGYTSPAGKSGVWGVHIVYLGYGKSIATDTEGNTLREFTSNEFAVTASYGMTFGENVGAGISLKYIRVSLAPADVTQDHVEGSGSSFAVDVGSMWKLPGQHLQAGLAVTNMGPDIAFIDREQSDPLPFTARLGLAYTPVADDVSHLLVTADVEQSLVWLISGKNPDGTDPQRRSEIWHGGVEYRYVNLLAGRVGYVYDKDGDFNAATYGLGFIYKDKLSLDYANVPQAQDLERVHRWSLTFTF